MAYTDKKRLNDAVAICAGACFYWLVIMCRLLFYYFNGHQDRFAIGIGTKITASYNGRVYFLK
jgi:hypothetical protein